MSFEDKLPVDNCETCIRSNITKLPFNSKTEKKTKRPLELIHSDVCGPITPSTWDNKRG